MPLSIPVSEYIDSETAVAWHQSKVIHITGRNAISEKNPFETLFRIRTVREALQK
jgi:hypothetical protein